MALGAARLRRQCSPRPASPRRWRSTPYLESCTGQNVAGVRACAARGIGGGADGDEHARRANPLLGHIERAALLHDVGKLVIPQADHAQGLAAQRRASTRSIRSHVRVAADSAGARAVSGADRGRCSSRRASASTATGYPLGLRGSGDSARRAHHCRCRSVRHAARRADCSEPGTDATPANAELVRGAGTLFDPDVVKVWLRCLGSVRAPRTPTVTHS